MLHARFALGVINSGKVSRRSATCEVWSRSNLFREAIFRVAKMCLKWANSIDPKIGV